MQTVSYNTVRNLFGDLAGGQDVTVDPLMSRFNRLFNRAARRAWEWYPWPDLMLFEQRSYRDTYASGTTYAAPTASAPTEAWYPPAGKYYQALQGTTGNAPATIVNGAYFANGPYWAETGMSYTGSDWAANTAYTAATSSAAGTVLRNPADGRFYMCITSHTSGSTFDATKFGILTAFDPYVAYEQTGQTALGTVKAMWNGNFRTNPGQFKIPFELDERGARLTAPSVPSQVYVHFRKRCPSWAGAIWSTGALAVGLTRYYSSAADGFDGDFYTTISATGSTDSPESAPTKWSKIQIPTFLCDFCANAAKIGVLEGDSALDKALKGTGPMWDNLFDEAFKLEGQSGQFRRARAANV